MIAVENLSARRPPLALARVSFTLDAGVHALLGAPTEGGPLLLAVLAGRERTRGGSARVLDARAGDPSTARSIAYVPIAPSLPDALTVSETLRAAAAIRGDAPTPSEERLAMLGIESLANARVRMLAPEEARAVAMVEALTSSVAAVLLIDEPFVGVDPRVAEAIGKRIRARARAGACVVIATASPNDAATLANDVLVLSRGTLVTQATAPQAVAALASQSTRLRIVANDPRALLAELAKESAASDLETRDGAIYARGDDATELAAAVARAVVRANVDLIEMRAELPSVEELQAAATGAAAASYQAAFNRARTAPPVPARGSGTV